MEGIGLVVLLECIPSPPIEAGPPSFFPTTISENKFILEVYTMRYGSRK